MLVLLATGMVMGVSLVVAMGWLCRNRWPYSATQVPRHRASGVCPHREWQL